MRCDLRRTLIAANDIAFWHTPWRGRSDCATGVWSTRRWYGHLPISGQFYSSRSTRAADSIDQVSVKCLTDYLKQAHTYFLDFQLPAIRRKLLEALDCSQPGEVSYLILKFYDDYMGEVRKHMQHENRKVFGYVDQLLQGHRTGEYSISQFARGHNSHNSIDVKLQEQKYYYKVLCSYRASWIVEQRIVRHLYLWDRPSHSLSGRGRHLCPSGWNTWEESRCARSPCCWGRRQAPRRYPLRTWTRDCTLCSMWLGQQTDSRPTLHLTQHRTHASQKHRTQT